MEVVEKNIEPYDVYNADEAFMTGTPFCMLPVTKLNNVNIDSGNVGKIYNVGTGKPQTVNYLSTLVGGKQVFIPDRPGEPVCSCANISKIKRELKWMPKIKFKDGIAKMLEEIEMWKDAPLWTPKTIKNATKTWFKFVGKKTDG